MEGYLNISIADKIAILKQLHIWKQMTKVEKAEFKSCTNENYADRLMRSYRSKYLN